jgi:hypothetical protein
MIRCIAIIAKATGIVVLSIGRHGTDSAMLIGSGWAFVQSNRGEATYVSAVYTGCLWEKNNQSVGDIGSSNVFGFPRYKTDVFRLV